MKRLATFAVQFAIFAAVVLGSTAVRADPQSDALSADARQALVNLYAANPKAAVLGWRAHAVLVFPRIKKADLTARPFTSFTGGYGDGALIKNGATVGFYNFVSGSWARMGSVAPYTLVLFLMTPNVEASVASAGMTLGAGNTRLLSGPNLANIHANPAPDASAYGLAFDEQGPIQGLSLNNSKVTPIKR